MKTKISEIELPDLDAIRHLQPQGWNDIVSEFQQNRRKLRLNLLIYKSLYKFIKPI